MFQVKSFEELLVRMINWVKGASPNLTDFSIGSKIRTILESVASLGEEMYITLWQGLKDTIEENIYVAFDFSLLPPRSATGSAVFSRATAAGTDYTIPVGTIISTQQTDTTSAIRFTTTEIATLTTGNTQVEVPISAEVAGISGNVVAGTITQFITKPSGIETVSNASALINGRDLETRDERKNRFRQYFASRSRGTLAALEFCALEVDEVLDAKAVESPYVNVLIWDGTAYTNVSAEANDPYEVSVDLLPAIEAQDHAVYIGASDKFPFVYIKMTQVGVGSGGVWEYYNGSTWATIPAVVDGTTQLTVNGVVTFTPPTNWMDNKIGDIWAFWIRFRVTTASYTTTPEIGHLFVSPPPGIVELYVHDGLGNAPNNMLTAVQTAVELYRGAGIAVNVKSPTKLMMDITCYIQVATFYDKTEIQTQTESTITGYLNSLTLGENLIISRLVNQIMSLESGDAIIRADITVPANDILTSAGEIIRPDVITVVVVN